MNLLINFTRKSEPGGSTAAAQRAKTLMARGTRAPAGLKLHTPPPLWVFSYSASLLNSFLATSWPGESCLKDPEAPPGNPQLVQLASFFFSRPTHPHKNSLSPKSSLHFQMQQNVESFPFPKLNQALKPAPAPAPCAAGAAAGGCSTAFDL